MKHLLSNFAIIAIAVLSSCSSPGNDSNSIENAMPTISIALKNEQTALLSIQAFNSHNVNEIFRR